MSPLTKRAASRGHLSALSTKRSVTRSVVRSVVSVALSASYGALLSARLVSAEPAQVEPAQTTLTQMTERPKPQAQPKAEPQAQPKAEPQAQPKAEPQAQPQAESQAEPRTFDPARAYQHLKDLVAFGERYYGAPKRPEAIETLAARLKSTGASVSTQAFMQREPRSSQEYKLTNVIGRLYPERPIRVILGSHWDTRLWAEEDADPARRQAPITGANDGTSGVAVLLELARVIPYLGLGRIGVDIVLFDGEEFGRPGSNDYCAGSRYFARHLKDHYPTQPPIAVIVIDMVGDIDLAFPPEQSSIRYARELTALVWRAGAQLKLPAFLRGLGYGDKPAPPSRYIIDDHTPFQELKIPAILLIDLEYQQWHTHQDTLDRVSPASLDQTGRALAASLQRLDQLAR